MQIPSDNQNMTMENRPCTSMSVPFEYLVDVPCSLVTINQLVHQFFWLQVTIFHLEIAGNYAGNLFGPWCGHDFSRKKIGWLVVGPPLWKIWKSIGMMKFPIYGKIKNVPNHQPVSYWVYNQWKIYQFTNFCPVGDSTGTIVGMPIWASTEASRIVYKASRHTWSGKFWEEMCEYMCEDWFQTYIICN